MRFPRYRKKLLLAIVSVLLLGGIGAAGVASAAPAGAVSAAQPVRGGNCLVVYNDFHRTGNKITGDLQIDCPNAAKTFLVGKLKKNGTVIGQNQGSGNGRGNHIRLSGQVVGDTGTICVDYLWGYQIGAGLLRYDYGTDCGWMYLTKKDRKPVTGRPTAGLGGGGG